MDSRQHPVAIHNLAAQKQRERSPDRGCTNPQRPVSRHMRQPCMLGNRSRWTTSIRIFGPTQTDAPPRARLRFRERPPSRRK